MKVFYIQGIVRFWILVLLGNSLSVSVGFAQDLTIIPHLFTSYRDCQYSVNRDGVNGSVYSLGGGLTATYRRFYIDVAGEKNPYPSKESPNNLLLTNKVDFNREDVAISVGYGVNDFISTFIGYKYGKTTIVALAPSPFVGSRISLAGKGLFIGAGGGWPVKNWGFLSFSAAYANMSATYKDLVVNATQGDASGTSLTIKWKAPITENLYYDMSLIRHDYYYQKFNKPTSDISEQILSVRLGLGYRF